MNPWRSWRLDRLWPDRGCLVGWWTVASLICQCTLSMAADAPAKAVTLVDNGQPRAVLVLAEDAFQYEVHAVHRVERGFCAGQRNEACCADA